MNYSRLKKAVESEEDKDCREISKGKIRIRHIPTILIMFLIILLQEIMYYIVAGIDDFMNIVIYEHKKKKKR